MIVSIITGIVMFLFAVFQLDPITNMFFWFSGLAVVAIVLIEALVCVAIIRFFLQNKGTENVFVTMIAPILAFVGLVLAEYLLMSRFGLLAGEKALAAGVDPTVTAFGLNTFGWFLVLSPFIVLAIGYVVSLVRKSVNEELLQDVIS
jgi:amino acid transporter